MSAVFKDITAAVGFTPLVKINKLEEVLKQHNKNLKTVTVEQKAKAKQ